MVPVHCGIEKQSLRHNDDTEFQNLELCSDPTKAITSWESTSMTKYLPLKL